MNLLKTDSCTIPFINKDTSSIKILSPTKQKEQSVFSDSKLKYKQNIKGAPSLIDRFLSWLSDWLFGNVGYDNLNRTRTIIIWTVIVIAVAIIIWLLSKTQLVSLIKPKPKATFFNFTDITEDLNTINFEQKIADALKTADYRLAIRWHYLKILFVLDKKQLIVFAPFKTNVDYMYELKKDTYKTSYKQLSRIYEYIWYGQFAVNESSYTDNAIEFKNFEHELNV